MNQDCLGGTCRRCCRGCQEQRSSSPQSGPFARQDPCLPLNFIGSQGTPTVWATRAKNARSWSREVVPCAVPRTTDERVKGRYRSVVIIYSPSTAHHLGPAAIILCTAVTVHAARYHYLGMHRRSPMQDGTDLNDLCTYLMYVRNRLPVCTYQTAAGILGARCGYGGTCLTTYPRSSP